MHDALISILMPVKNTAAYLSDCITSVRRQSYTNWELIAINDHSTDNSLEILKGYASDDSRIQVYQNNGKGIIEALRLAFSKSKGHFITRMDSDDIMHPDKLTVLQSSLIKSGRGNVAIGQVKYFSETGISNGYQRYEAWLNSLTLTGNNYSDLYKECVIPSPSWMIYKEDLMACDDFKPNRYPEDYDLTFRCYENGLQCIPCNKVLHFWRDYPNRTSRTHIHYAQNYFLDIKLYYFLKLHYNEKRPLTVWGAGNKGKTIAKNLLDHKIPFFWVCDNPKKINKEIYHQTMRDFSFLKTLDRPQSIVTVANEEAQKEIQNYMHKNEMQSMTDYFFFC
ncbi:glycosyltransferase [Flavobacteriaceae bacterium R38]|nr:glycosyltransferase [Flavobacteriaceae bacterium R38]